MRFVFLALLLWLAMLAACGTPAMPVIQAAGMAKTAYDYSDVVMPRSRVDFLGVSVEDKNIEHEVVKRLREQHVRYVSAAPFALDGHLFLLGVFDHPDQAERARRIARNVPGVRRLTCSFFRPAPGNASSTADHELARRIAQRLETDQTLQSARIRVGILQRNAVLMGRVTDPGQKRKLESMLRTVHGIGEIRSYLAVRG